MVLVLSTVIYASVELSPLCEVGLWPKGGYRFLFFRGTTEWLVISLALDTFSSLPTDAGIHEGHRTT